MWEGIAGALIGVIVGGLSAYLLMKIQMQENRKIAQAELLLQFDENLRHYDKIHWALRPDGSWQRDKPKDISWAEVDAYLGLLERLYVLIENGIINTAIAKDFYQYRLDNIAANMEIKRERLFGDERDSWKRFVKLCTQLDVPISIGES